MKLSIFNNKDLETFGRWAYDKGYLKGYKKGRMEQSEESKEVLSKLDKAERTVRRYRKKYGRL